MQKFVAIIASFAVSAAAQAATSATSGSSFMRAVMAFVDSIVHGV
ncbi:hypothetical protein [Chitinimonas koreensis]|nr:hypothetical protein [Chitinimonas koreensis]